MRKVTTVVPVLITSCHVSLKWKMGPVNSHATMTTTASRNAEGRPAAREIALAKLTKAEWDFVGRMSENCDPADWLARWPCQRPYFLAEISQWNTCRTR